MIRPFRFEFISLANLNDDDDADVDFLCFFPYFRVLNDRKPSHSWLSCKITNEPRCTKSAQVRFYFHAHIYEWPSNDSLFLLFLIIAIEQSELLSGFFFSQQKVIHILCLNGLGSFTNINVEREY